ARVSDSISRNNEVVIPGESSRIGSVWILPSVVWEKPDFAEFLVVAPGSRCEVVGPPIENQLRRLTFSGNPQFNVAVYKFITHPGAKRDSNLESHPLVREVSEAVAVRWEAVGSRLGIETVRAGAGILQLY